MALSLPVIFIIVFLLFVVGGAVAFIAFQKDVKRQQEQQAQKESNDR
ncbi:MAG: hypothetical protein UHX00_14790 [Caryophanon sp.]|nr:hypothetical protein [Caryophanon sp.]